MIRIILAALLICGTAQAQTPTVPTITLGRSVFPSDFAEMSAGKVDTAGGTLTSGLLVNPRVSLSGQAFSIGAPTGPVFKNATTTTGGLNNGSTSVVVANAAGIAVGQQAFNAALTPGTVVTGISSNTVTLSKPATSSVSGAIIQFGGNRWDALSSMLVGTLGANNVYIGGAASGNSTWLNTLSPGTDYPGIVPLISLAPPGGGGVAAVFGSRMSDQNGSFGGILPLNCFAYVDINPSHLNSWCKYTEADLTSSDVGYHLNEESSVYSLWPPVVTDPFNLNPLGGSRNLRIDSGKGPVVTTIGTYGSGATTFTVANSTGVAVGQSPTGAGFPLGARVTSITGNSVTINTPTTAAGSSVTVQFGGASVSDALEIINNYGAYLKGIVFGQNSIVTDPMVNLPVAMAFAPSQALTWYYANNTPGWSLYSDVTAAGGNQYQLKLGTGQLFVGNADIAVGGHFYGAQAAPALSSCGSGAALSPASTDTQGTITEGATTTGCRVTWVKPFALAPTCVVTSPTGNNDVTYVTSASSLLLSHSSATGRQYSYICMGS